MFIMFHTHARTGGMDITAWRGLRAQEVVGGMQCIAHWVRLKATWKVSSHVYHVSTRMLALEGYNCVL